MFFVQQPCPNVINKNITLPNLFDVCCLQVISCIMLYSLVLLAWEAVHLTGINRLQGLQSRKILQHEVKFHFKGPCQRPNFSSLERQMKKYDNVSYFKTSLSHRQQFLTRNILKVCTDTLTENNITFFMTAGTLLGSYMHHGMIPWDDDLDLFLPVSEKVRIHAALLKLQPKYRVVKVYPRWKFFSNESSKFKRYEWAWPFIDLVFYADHGRYIREIDHLRREKFDKSYVFPLIKRPYWDLLLPAPRNTSRYLKKRYSLNKCVTNNWNHSSERPTGKHSHKRIDCKLLYDSHPFVFRTQLGSQNINCVNESLWVGNCLLSSDVIVMNTTADCI